MEETSLSISKSIIDWLLDGDVSIRFQVMRDLLNTDGAVINKESEKQITDIKNLILNPDKDTDYIKFWINELHISTFTIINS
ncbi:MAG: hypothetical protein JXB49_11380 [Bacteroidales bacterium]|nr:hypothetical protein [Bacteroidales bacterium]